MMLSRITRLLFPTCDLSIAESLFNPTNPDRISRTKEIMERKWQMCYTNGPRCSKEGLKAYNKALQRGHAEDIKKAKLEYYTTTDGIAKLQAQGLSELAGQFQERRAILIATSKTIDAEKAAQKLRKERYEASLKSSGKPSNSNGSWSSSVTPVFKSRKSKVAIVAGTGFLAASLLTGCSTSDEAEYAAVCKDAKSDQRVSDDKCSDGSSGGSSAFLWYFMGMNSRVPSVGSPLSGGTTSIPDTSNYKTGVSPSGETVTKSGFGKSGAVSKSSSTSGGFGSGGAKGGGRGSGGSSGG